MQSRRDILKAGVGAGLFAGAGALAPWRALAQGAGAPLVTMLTPDLALIAGVGGNVLAASDGAGLTLADAGSAERSGDLLAALAETFPGQAVQSVINTHWHPEQTGGNLALAEAGAKIAAHANTRLWLTTDVDWPWGGRTEPAPEAAWPAEIFYWDPYETGEGAARARAGYMLQAHTDGDVWVLFPEANVIHVGGAIAPDRWPEIDWWTGGWIGGLMEATETLLSVSDADTRFVAATGAVFDRAEMQAQRDMYETLFFRFRDELIFKGLSPDEAVAARPTADFHPEWTNPDTFVMRAFQSLWGYYAPDA